MGSKSVKEATSKGRAEWLFGGVREFVPFGTLYDIVKDQYCAMIAGFKDEDVLKLGFLVVEDLIDFEGHGLARPHAGNLSEPAICSEDSVSPGLS